MRSHRSRRRFIPMKPLLIIGLLLICPLIGVWWINQPLPAYISRPPIPTHPGFRSFSWLAFAPLAVVIVGVLSPFIFRVMKYSPSSHPPSTSAGAGRLPWWGWGAVAWTVIAWVLAWNRFSWFDTWQPHTFLFLWFGYPVVINALTYARSGRCLLLHHRAQFFLLFPLSVGFWWMFEYLNQFVNNWHYVNLIETDPLERVLLSSLAFSTVLPAVVSTREFLATIPRLSEPFRRWHQLPHLDSAKTGWMLLGGAGLGLTLIGVWPTVLFPFLWIAPLGLLWGIPLIRQDPTLLRSLAEGDWRPVIHSSVAAATCGFWWELWNAGSLVHWKYTIPYVHGYTVFQMPILGYAGYLPFGLVCLAVAEQFLNLSPGHGFLLDPPPRRPYATP